MLNFFWVEASHVAVHLKNHIPSLTILAGKCPYLILHGHAPNEIHLIRTLSILSGSKGCCTAQALSKISSMCLFRCVDTTQGRSVVFTQPLVECIFLYMLNSLKQFFHIAVSQSYPPTLMPFLTQVICTHLTRASPTLLYLVRVQLSLSQFIN
jgi:hypothetical protein